MTARAYINPREINQGVLSAQAARRRKALVDAGCSTYALGMRGGQPSIVCLCCGLGSANPNDIRQHYCGFCRAFHGEERPE